MSFAGGSISASSSVSNRAVSLDWHATREGQGILAHLTEPDTNRRKLYGSSSFWVLARSNLLGDVCEITDGLLKRHGR